MSDSSAYPETPAGWSTVARRQVGPFTTHVTYRQPDGTTVGWSSRVHRKHGPLRSRIRERDRGVWWAPRRASWWIGVLFAVGSACFFVGPFPGFVELVGSAADGLVFFVGSLFFTSAAVLQYLETVNADRGPGATARRRLRVFTFEPRRIDWWSCVVQVAGTLLFNVDTFRALQTGFDSPSYDRLVWAPDAAGSVCFLVGSVLLLPESAPAVVGSESQG